MELIIGGIVLTIVLSSAVRDVVLQKSYFRKNIK